MRRIACSIIILIALTGCRRDPSEVIQLGPHAAAQLKPFAEAPSPSDLDNARYVLYKCRGGYPIGIFSVYVRSSIAQEGETEATQVFMVVGFNFYGREDWPRTLEELEQRTTQK